MNIARTADSEYRCFVSRPSGTSYLFFQQFEMKVIGFKIKHANAQVGTRLSFYL